MTSKTIKLYDSPLKHMPFSVSGNHLSYDRSHGGFARSKRRGFEISINKWQIIVNNPNISVNGGTETCGLCHLYHEERCKGCPVFESTGQEWCDGTPYDDWDKSKTRENAQAELDFLIDLATKHGYTIERVPESDDE